MIDELNLAKNMKVVNKLNEILKAYLTRLSAVEIVKAPLVFFSLICNE